MTIDYDRLQANQLFLFGVDVPLQCFDLLLQRASLAGEGLVGLLLLGKKGLTVILIPDDGIITSLAPLESAPRDGWSQEKHKAEENAQS
jgi:hypothetical protein